MLTKGKKAAFLFVFVLLAAVIVICTPVIGQDGPPKPVEKLPIVPWLLSGLFFSLPIIVAFRGAKRIEVVP
jgi:hypothetical protein